MNKVARAQTDERNQALLSEIFATDERGMQKRASSPRLKEWFQTYLRNDGVARRTMDPEPISADEFAYTDDSIDPYVIRTFQPYSAGAIGVNYDTGTMQTYMHANKYRIYMLRIFSPVYRIDKIFLEAYRGPLVDVFKDLMMMDVLQKEDKYFVALSNQMLPAKGAVDPNVGVKRYIDLGGSVTSENFFTAIQGMALSKQGLSAARVLMQRAMWIDLIKTFKAYEQTNGVVEKTLFGNTEALEENLCGVKWITALSTSLVPYRKLYVYTEPARLGDFLTYGEAEIFTEVERNIILKMGAQEMVGMNMPNPGAIFSVDFTVGEAPDTWLDDGSSN